MAKQQKYLRILKISEYKGFHVIAQQIIPQHLFQFIAFRNGKFYQGFNIITPKGNKKKHSSEDLVKCASLILDYAYTSIDVIIGQENPEQFLKENAQAAEVVRVLEKLDKEDKKKSQKMKN